MILDSEPELKEVQTVVLKHLGTLPKIRGGGNSAKVWVSASSETVTVLVYWTCLVGGGSVR